MKRDLHPVPIPRLTEIPPGTMLITMDTEQWDPLLSAAYADGWILLELDENEIPVAAYQRQAS